ncbi:hypothetical protein TNCV_77721 [Trichonephila clavipes]|nr:hypothetical protein TNCV_77721 [Trichonephila clavipes]
MTPKRNFWLSSCTVADSQIEYTQHRATVKGHESNYIRYLSSVRQVTYCLSLKSAVYRWNIAKNASWNVSADWTIPLSSYSFVAKFLSLMCELIYKSDSPQFSAGTIRKNVGTGGGEKKKREVSRKYHSYYPKFGFIEEPESELDPRPVLYVLKAYLTMH